MKHNNISDLSWDDFDELRDPRPDDNGFDKVVERAIDRRGFLGGVLAFGSGAAVFGSGLVTSASANAVSKGFDFEPIGISTDFDIHIPAGYQWKTFIRYGDPLFAEAESAYSSDGLVALDKVDMVFGENTDGMESFEVDGKMLLAINSEYANPKINLPEGAQGMPKNEDEVNLIKHIQGVTVLEVADNGNGMDVVLDSPYNRRIHHETPMMMDGPLAGSDYVKTNADPEGMSPVGTMNNCGSGKTLWDTYLTCEENFNGYFGATMEHEPTPGETRYGIGGESRYAYEKFDPRFDITAEPNEPHRHGWITEIDPKDPNAIPVKHSALGRFKHENAEMVQAKDGRVVVYMGDDERGEFLYKYISNGTWSKGGSTDGLLSDGQLYVAKFNDDQTG